LGSIHVGAQGVRSPPQVALEAEIGSVVALGHLLRFRKVFLEQILASVAHAAEKVLNLLHSQW